MMVYKWELKRNGKGLLIWSAVLCGFVLLMMGMYPSFAEDAGAMEDMLGLFPDSVQAVFGMDTLSLATFNGFYGVEVHLVNTLIGSVYAALLAAGILAKEEDGHTAEFLLAKPVTRMSVAGQKLAAVFTNLFVLNAAITAISFASTGFADEQVAFDILAHYMIATFLLHATFAAVSFLLSALTGKTRNIVPLSLGIVFVSYVLHIAAGLSDALAFLGHASLFACADAAAIVKNGGLEGGRAVVMLTVILLCIGCAIGYYRKKDITG